MRVLRGHFPGYASFPFGCDGGMWDLIGIVPDHCTARSPLSLKVMECSFINPALSLLTKYLVIGRHQKSS